MIQAVHPGSRSRFFTHPGSRIQGSKRLRVFDPDPQHCLKQCFGSRSRFDLALLDPDHMDVDQDPAFHFDADPDPASQKESQLGLCCT
jgi:hypothetical protein